MKAKKKVVIITACVCSLLLVIGVVFHFSKNYLIDLGIIHLSEEDVISYFEKNKDDLKIAADYVLNQSTFCDENTETQKSDKEFKPGEIIESLGIYHSKKGYYGCKIYNKITGNENSDFLKEIQPYDINPEVEPSFNELTKGYIRSVETKETVNNSTYVNFLLTGYAIYDQQHIVYFKDKEHDLRFRAGYKVVPLSEEGWYYLALGDAENW